MPSYIARDGTIDTSTKTLLLVLASFAGADQSCFPSNATLCDCTGLSESTVRRLLREAEKRELVVTLRRTADNGAPLSNLYRLNFAKWGGISNDSDARSNLQGGGRVSEGRVGAPVKGGRAHPSAPNMTSEQNQGTEPSFALASEAPTATKAKAPKTNCITNPPTLADFIARFAEVGTSSDEEAERCWHYYADNGWRMSNGKPLVNWRQSAGTWARAHPAKPSTPKYTYVPPPPLKYDDFGRVIK